MYLDADCVLALIKKGDWLGDAVCRRLKGERAPMTSVLTVVECQLVLSREEGRERITDVGKAIGEKGISLLPIDGNILERSNDLLKRYDLLGIFDSIHAATAMTYGEVLLSTDHVFPLIDDLVVEDPRGIARTIDG